MGNNTITDAKLIHLHDEIYQVEFTVNNVDPAAVSITDGGADGSMQRTISIEEFMPGNQTVQRKTQPYQRGEFEQSVAITRGMLPFLEKVTLGYKTAPKHVSKYIESFGIEHMVDQTYKGQVITKSISGYHLEYQRTLLSPYVPNQRLFFILAFPADPTKGDKIKIEIPPYDRQEGEKTANAVIYREGGYILDDKIVNYNGPLPEGDLQLRQDLVHVSGSNYKDTISAQLSVGWRMLISSDRMSVSDPSQRILTVVIQEDNEATGGRQSTEISIDRQPNEKSIKVIAMPGNGGGELDQNIQPYLS